MTAKAKYHGLPISPAAIPRRIHHEWDVSDHIVLSQISFSSLSSNPRNFVETITLLPANVVVSLVCQFSLTFVNQNKLSYCVKRNPDYMYTFAETLRTRRTSRRSITFRGAEHTSADITSLAEKWRWRKLETYVVDDTAEQNVVSWFCDEKGLFVYPSCEDANELSDSIKSTLPYHINNCHFFGGVQLHWVSARSPRDYHMRRILLLQAFDFEHIYIYTGCPGRNVPDFGRMFLKFK